MERPSGICRIPSGYGSEDSAWVRYPKGNGYEKYEVPEDLYRASGYEPPFEDLPECNGEPDTPRP